MKAGGPLWEKKISSLQGALFLPPVLVPRPARPGPPGPSSILLPSGRGRGRRWADPEGVVGGPEVGGPGGGISRTAAAA